MVNYSGKNRIDAAVKARAFRAISKAALPASRLLELKADISLVSVVHVHLAQRESNEGRII